MIYVIRILSIILFYSFTYVHASNIYLVLASANQQNAASAMGHLFLAEGSPATPLSEWKTVDYAARIEGSGFIHKIKGIVGGFEATYKVQHLSKEIELYQEKEKRELLFFPLYFSDTGKKRYHDTLNLWLEKKEDYKFATNNCSHGIYRLLQATMDSLPEPHMVLLPQDIVSLLQTKNKIGKPHKNYISPHPYSRMDFGFRFLENTAILQFQPFLHDKYDRYGFYQADHELSILALSVGIKKKSAFIDKFSVYKMLSASPEETFSWFIDSRLDGFGIGIGKSFAIYQGKFATDFFLKILNEKTEGYFIVPELTFRSRSIRNYRYGMQSGLFRRVNTKEIEPAFNFWFAYDLSENNAFIIKSNLNAEKPSIEAMLRMYIKK